MDKINVREILDQENLAIYFHPIVSILKKSILGVEALCRAYHPVTKKFISPAALFQSAKDQGLILELECLTRKKSIELFYSHYPNHEKLLLFLNVSSYMINQKIFDSKELHDAIKKLNINPNQIVLEIVESKIENIELIESFVKIYRGLGFLIALDDLGSGQSNLERIFRAKPDIIKLDRTLIQDIDKESYKQKFFKSLVNLSKKIKALVVAEGVETVEECLFSLQMGADLLQGFYFTQPKEISHELFHVSDSQIQNLSSYFQVFKQEKINLARKEKAGHENIVERIMEQIIHLNQEEMEQKISSLIKKYPFIECVYLLDENGFQVSQTICNEQNISPQRKLIFHPAQKGQDHTLKDYYLFIKSGLERHTTEPYISLASGNLCITIATLIELKELDKKMILCIDINS